MLGLVLCLLVGSALTQQAPDLETVLASKPHYSMVLDLIKTAGVMDDLKNAAQLTLFAPTNQALLDIPNDEYRDLKADVPRLKEFLLYHVTTDAAWKHNGLSSNDLTFKSLNNGLPIRVNVYWQLHTVAAEGVNITERNVPVANGFIQGLDGIMEAPGGDVVDIINAMDETKTLARLIATSGLDSVIRNDKNITVFAPADYAWDDLDPAVLTYLENNPKTLQDVLLYHVVQKTTLYSIGMRHQMTFPTSDSRHDSLMLLESPDDDDDEIFLNSALIADRDISATNGVIHTLEQVLIPPNVLIELEDQGLGHVVG